MFDAFNWWENDFFKEFRPFCGFLHALKKVRLLPILASWLEKDICRNMRDEPNLYTFRTADYMLSTAQDYRAGYGGDQHHVWQATLGPDAVCFTTHPVKRSSGTPNYWTGSGTLPRVVQIQNVVIAIYKFNLMPGLYVTNNLNYTHAWLPKNQFDEVVEKDDWIFTCKGNGYLALRSQRPYQWLHDLSLGGDAMADAIAPVKTSEHNAEGRSQDTVNEVIAEGRQNIWICELGCSEDDGDFFEFVTKICQAEIHFDGQSVRYQSPSQGWLEFGWQGPLLQSGQVVPINNYPRYDNDYCQAEFWAERLFISNREDWLKLEWNSCKREMSSTI
jgi:hypothetical protein